VKKIAATTLLAPVSWGTTYVVITELLPTGRPLLVGAVRVAPAGLVLVAAGLLASPWRPRGADWWRTGLLALCNFGLFFPLLAVAVYRMPGGVAAAVGGAQPLLVAGVTWLVTGTRPRRLDLVVGVVAAAGVALVVLKPGAAGIDPVGVLAAFGANVAFSVGVVLTRRFPVPPNRIAATGWQLLLGAAALVPLMLVVEGLPPAPTASGLAGYAYLSLVATALAFVLWFTGIRRLPAPAPPLLGLASPVTGAVTGWLVLDQSLSPVQLAGFVVTLGAIAYGAVLAGPTPAIGAGRGVAPGRSTRLGIGERCAGATPELGDRRGESPSPGFDSTGYRRRHHPYRVGKLDVSGRSFLGRRRQLRPHAEQADRA
jgi:probable blue pigment (indigoidine) exporter